MVTMDHP